MPKNLSIPLRADPYCRKRFILVTGVLIMSPSPASPPFADHLALHRRLVERDPTAPADLAVEFLQTLIDWLAEHNRSVHPDLVGEAAEEAILALIRNPLSYRPEDSPLERYLRMSARGDLKNLLHRETTHRARTARLEVVELSDVDGKYLGREDDPALRLIAEEEAADLREAVPETVRAGLTAVEARVLELMLQRERRTAIYAEVCGVADRPIPEQRRLVKRIKDRLQKRLERGGGR